MKTSLALDEISELASLMLSVQRVKAMVMCEVSVPACSGEQVSGVRIRIAPTKRRVDRVSRRCSVVVTVNQKRS
ncbi:hypothetical protein Bca4012_067082 [Brassica carinata]